eukprot:SAG31_NODE_4793_length_2953_cov_14.309741_1_plen_66_part_00
MRSAAELSALQQQASMIDTAKFVCRPQCETALLAFDRLLRHGNKGCYFLDFVPAIREIWDVYREM